MVKLLTYHNKSLPSLQPANKLHDSTKSSHPHSREQLFNNGYDEKDDDEYLRRLEDKNE